MSIYLAILLLFYTIVCFARIDWALMFILAALPLYLLRFNIFGIPSTLLEIMILIIFAVWIFKNYKQLFRNIRLGIKNEKLKNSSQGLIKYPFGLELVLVLIVAFIAMSVSDFSDSAMGIWKAYFFEPIIVYLLIFNIFFRKKREEDFDLSKLFSKIILYSQRVLGGKRN